jgi:hypothetical protein
MLSGGGMTPKEKLLEWLEDWDVKYTLVQHDELGMTGSQVVIPALTFNEMGLVVSCGTLR